MAADDLIAFNEALRALAGEVYRTAAEGWGRTADWDRAFLDVRWSRTGRAVKFRLRVVLLDGSTRSLPTTAETDRLVNEVWRAKDPVFPDTVYGMMVVVTKAGECETTYNYDPNAYDDPAFDDELAS